MGKMITISAEYPVSAYEALPESEPKGAVLVIHEIWGLLDHTKSVADRVAAEGFVALAPNLLDNLDATPEELKQLQQDLFNPERRNEVQPRLRELTTPLHAPEFAGRTTERLRACFNNLYDRAESKQRVAVMGFCFGGTYSFNLAIEESRLALALPFYGHADQSVEELQKITCPVHAFYGEKDERLMIALPDLEERMKRAGVDFMATVYSDCGHAFFNDTNPYAYNKEAATSAWEVVKHELAKLES